MKVDQKIGPSLPGVDATKTGKVSNKGGLDKSGPLTGSSPAVGSTKIDLSDRAQMMQRAKEIGSRDTVDEAKVARLQKMIDEGKYVTDSSAIADKLVDEHMNFPD